jgi:hypothetical protein
LVQGFRAGQLNLKKDVPPGLAQLADPYDPSANALYRSGTYRLLDLSYYKGRLFLYFGVTPALIVFWPFVALTGHYLFHKQAAMIFCVLGFLVSVGLLCALWRRYFAELSVVVVAACTLALGLTTGVPIMLSRSDVYEVSVSCGYAFTMLALAAIWKALHQLERRNWWLAGASLAYGLAVGARPSLLLGAVVLLVPVLQARRERKKVWAPLLSATGPIVLMGLGLMLYNDLRFDNPFEFGIRYQLSGDPQLMRQFFSLRCLWCNFRMYFLEPARWSGRFPFVHDIAAPPLPAGYGRVEHPFGVMTNIPLVWLALPVLLGGRSRLGQMHPPLRRFILALALLFGTCALTMCLFRAACFRYQVEFLPALVLLAVIGILSLDRSLAPGSESGQVRRPFWWKLVRWDWSLLLGFSVAFNLLASVELRAEAHCEHGNALLGVGRGSEAVAQYEQALRFVPEYAEAHNNLGLALLRADKLREAIGHHEQAVKLLPDSARAHYNLGVALEQSGRVPEAITHFEQALRINPGMTEAQSRLARLRTP